jgi:hypothetical protein
MRQFVVFAVLVLFSGCICCGGKDLSLPGTDTNSNDGSTGECPPSYLLVGTSCCLDDNQNSICDTDETPETTLSEENNQQTTDTTETTETTLNEQTPETTQTTSTTQPVVTQTTQTTTTSATTLPATNAPQGETMKLSTGWQEFSLNGQKTGYFFRFDNKEGAGKLMKYWIEIKTSDGIVDKRPLSTGESFVDYLRFKLINYGEDQPILSIRANAEDLATVTATHPEAILITIGGQSCWPNPSAMCMRNYNGYVIQMINRFGNDGKYATLGVTPPGMGMSKINVPENGIATPDGTLIIGGFFDNSHYINGGYNLFYIYTT